MRSFGALGVCLMLLSAPTGAAAQNASITLEVLNVRVAIGSVRVDICTKDTFLKVTCPYSGASVAAEGTTTVVVEGVPPGTYAAQVYHDENDNHKVDRGPLGIPKEGIGFSNDAPLGLHGPSFTKASFVHDETPLVMSVRLHHFGHSEKAPDGRLVTPDRR